MDLISKIISMAGLSMSAEKKEIGERLVFLGVFIALEKMTLSFDETQARDMWVQLKGYVAA